MTIGEIYENAKRKLDKNEITIGEFAEIVDVEVDAYKPPIGHWIKYREPYEDCISREKAKQFLYERLDILNDDELYDIFSRIIDDMYNELPSVTPKYTDEEIDKAQAVEQAYIDKMVELVAEEAKRPKGKWIVCDVVRYGDFAGEEKYECSKCHHRVGIFKSNFCPNCGARMTESEEEE